LTYSHPVARLGLLTVGLSGKVEIRTWWKIMDHSPDQTSQSEHLPPGPDGSALRAAGVEPRAALDGLPGWAIRRFAQLRQFFFAAGRTGVPADPRTSYKLVYGRPFRTPSVYEQYYQDGISQVANLHLRPETAEAVELSAERKLGKSAYGLINAYHYSLRSVIEAVWIQTR
jgi:hypothetical protein